ncbi:hypothetical protein [Paraburkholderia graminis]|jgi:hypothetical protein|uniref:Uncharacterized protein n=1 Tax=Paraburkholderia graminis TaxID=60548 RepID=A0ABD5CFV4_9BURK|nr:hypothetical protein [Paraburkholderia graminis]MDR6203465.1 hypothetical protein [Paraburkholderia graminis]
MITLKELHKRAGNPDLDHWTGAAVFSLQEAALLTVGADPLEWPSVGHLKTHEHPNWRYAAIGLRTLCHEVCTGEVARADVTRGSDTREHGKWLLIPN